MKKLLLIIPLLFLVNCGGDNKIYTPDHADQINDNTNRIEKLEKLENSIDNLEVKITNIEEFLDINTYETFSDLISNLNIYTYGDNGDLTELQTIINQLTEAVDGIEDGEDGADGEDGQNGTNGSGTAISCSGSILIEFGTEGYIEIYTNNGGVVKLQVVEATPTCE